MYPTFATAVYGNTKSTVESRVQSSLNLVRQKYEEQLSKLEAERAAGTYAYNMRLYDTRKGRILSSLKHESGEIQREADRYMHTLGLKEKIASKPEKAKTTLHHIGARAWAKSAAGARMQPLLIKSGSDSIRSADPDSNWNPFLGYIGPPTERTSSTWVDASLATRMSSDTQETERGQCFKLDKNPKSFDSIQQALLYLKLREDGCTKEKSMVYSVKRRCMTDSTMKRDGPSCHRTIVVGDNRTTGTNWKGWQLHPPLLKMGPKYSLIEDTQDLKEYEILAKEFERLRIKQEKIREGMYFEDIDNTREKYFRSLTREWDRRQEKVTKSTEPPSRLSNKAPSQVSSKHSLSVLETPTAPPLLLPPLPVVPAEQPEAPTILTITLTEPTEPSSLRSPQATVETANLSTERGDDELSTKPSLMEVPPSVWIDPSHVSTFQSGSLVIRSLVPCKPSLPEISKPRKLERKLTRTRTRTNFVHEDRSLPSLGSYQDLVSRMRHKTMKDRLSDLSSFSPKGHLVLGIAKMFTDTPPTDSSDCRKRVKEEPAKTPKVSDFREIKEQSFSLEISKDESRG